jgi:AcrR family transcriptional regulator
MEPTNNKGRPDAVPDIRPETGPAIRPNAGPGTVVVLSDRQPASRVRQPAQTRARIVAAAIDLLHRHGYAATTTILVAERAAVSRGALLHHFPEKSSLMAGVVQAAYEADAAFYRRALSAAITPVERVDLLVESAWIRFKSPDGIAQVEVWQASRSDPELAAVVLPVHQENVRRSTEGMHRILAEAAPIRPEQSRSLLIFTVAALRGLAMQLALGTPEADLLPGVAQIKRSLRAALEDVAGAAGAPAPPAP